MTKIKKILGVVLGILLLIVLPVHAQENSFSNNQDSRPHRDQIGEIFNELHLTDDQKKQLDANKQSHRLCMQQCRQELKNSKEEIRREIMKPQLDMSKIHALHKRIKELLSKMEDDKLNSILAVRTILTPDQFMKFIELMHHDHPEHD